MESAPHIAYLTSVYPRASDTFIRGEVANLRRLGCEIETFSVRRPDVDQLLTRDIREESDQTTYLFDSSKLGLLAVLLSETVRAPKRMFSAACLAWRTTAPGIKDHLRMFAYLAEAARCSRAMREIGVQHLHNHIAENSANVAMLASEMSGIPFSMTVHGPGIFFRPQRWALGEKIARSAFTACISYFCRSQCMIFAEPKHWDKLKVVRCGVDRALIEQTVTPVPDGPRFVCVGRLCPEKGQLLLVEAVRRLRDQDIDCELKLIGDGELRPEIEAAIDNYKLHDQIKLLGWMSSEKVFEHIRDSRALVLPSFAEGLPVVIMEALALGRPVISSRIAAIGELVEDGVNGWLTAPSDVEAIVAAMAECASATSDLIAKMGLHGMARVSKHHDGLSEATRLFGFINSRS